MRQPSGYFLYPAARAYELVYQDASSDISGDSDGDSFSESKQGEKDLQKGTGRRLLDVDRSLRSDCGYSRSATLEKHGDPSGVDPVQMVGFSVLVR